MAVDGTWVLRLDTPGAGRLVELVLAADGESLTGTFDGEPIANGQTDGANVVFNAEVISPVKLKVKCFGFIDGDTMNGTAKAAMMKVAFVGERKRS
jgi:hypothetical protein